MKRALLAIAIAACGEPKTEFECDGNAACRDGNLTGVCEETGFCSFDDAECSTGRRYGAVAGEGLGEQCVDDGPSPIGDWEQAVELPQSRYSLAVAADANNIYAIGGIAGPTGFPDVSIAPVTSSAFGASLSAWTSGTQLPAPRRAFGAAVADGFVYAIGGRVTGGTDVGFSSDVLAAPISGTGIGDWQAGTPLPAGLRCHAVAQSGTTVYVTGGKAGNDDGVTSVVIGTMSNGDVTWRPGSAMGTARFCHSLTVANGFVYAIGGCSSGNNGCTAGQLDSVEVAKILDDGSLGPFTPTRSLPYGLWHHTSAGNSHYLTVMAGRDTAAPDGIDRVLVTHINPDGSLGIWREVDPLAHQRSRSVATVIANQLFLIGSDVQTATLKP